MAEAPERQSSFSTISAPGPSLRTEAIALRALSFELYPSVQKIGSLLYMK
jgi:hypothetical protein